MVYFRLQNRESPNKIKMIITSRALPYIYTYTPDFFFVYNKSVEFFFCMLYQWKCFTEVIFLYFLAINLSSRSEISSINLFSYVIKTDGWHYGQERKTQ